jgi:hypothetical protein
MENLERQLEEIEVLEAIYPDELTVDACILEAARQHLDVENGLPKTLLSLTMRLARLASLEPSGKLNRTHPSITIEFPREYPETSPPLVTKTSGLDTYLMTIIQTCLEDHTGEESIMQLVTSINEKIQTRNESTVEDYETGIQKREQEEQLQLTLSGLSSQKEVDPDSKPVIGRRIINSPYILKPAKIKDIKKCADELKLGGYAKVGKPGIIIIEGPEEGCKQYCPMLENRGWKHQKVKGEQTKEGPAGGTVDELRGIRNGTSAGDFEFEVLGGDTTVADLGKLCREAGLADLFFGSLNIHDSSADGAKEKTTTNNNNKEGSRKKGGKR